MGFESKTMLREYLAKNSEIELAKDILSRSGDNLSVSKGGVNEYDLITTLKHVGRDQSFARSVIQSNPDNIRVVRKALEVAGNAADIIASDLMSQGVLTAESLADSEVQRLVEQSKQSRGNMEKKIGSGQFLPRMDSKSDKNTPNGSEISTMQYGDLQKVIIEKIKNGDVGAIASLPKSMQTERTLLAIAKETMDQEFRNDFERAASAAGSDTAQFQNLNEEYQMELYSQAAELAAVAGVGQVADTLRGKAVSMVRKRIERL